MAKSNSAPTPGSHPRVDLPPDFELRGEVPVDQLRPSPTNPRKTFPEESLRGLSATMAEHGVLTPLLVRPHGRSGGPKATFRDGDWHHVDHFEVVDGERRYRAARLIGLDVLPVTVRNLTDRQVLLVQAVANDQREDVLPSEQAAAYARLVATGMSPEEVATGTGRSPAAVRGLLRLARLPAWALAAVDDGRFSRATAEVTARVPGERNRELAAATALVGRPPPAGVEVGEWVTEQIRTDALSPLSYRDTRAMIHTDFTRELKTAPFDRRSLVLLPSAGSCQACPNRSGNDPEATADGARADLCLDPDCYRLKVEAFRAVEVAKAGAKGIQPAPEELEFQSPGDTPPRGWCDLLAQLARSELIGECPLPDADDRRAYTLAKLLGPECPQRYLAFGRDGRPRVVVKTTEARPVLQKAGVLTGPGPEPAGEPRAPRAERGTRNAERKKGRAPRATTDGATVEERAIGLAVRELASAGVTRLVGLRKCRGAEEGGPVRTALRLVARFLVDELRSGRPPEAVGEDEAGEMPAGQVLVLCLQLIGAHLLRRGPADGLAADLLAWAGLDWGELKQRARGEAGVDSPTG